MDLNELQRKGFEKLANEKNAFAGRDLADISFEIGRGGYGAYAFLLIAAFAVLFGGRFLARRGIGGAALSVGDFLFWLFIAAVVIAALLSLLLKRKKTGISVMGGTIFCDGNCYPPEEVTRVRCTRWLERVEVFAGKKKILSAEWNRDNAELLIAWARRCGIPFEDKRFKRFDD